MQITEKWLRKHLGQHPENSRMSKLKQFLKMLFSICRLKYPFILKGNSPTYK